MKNLNSKTILGWAICRDLPAFTQRLAVIMMMCMLCVSTAWAQDGDAQKQVITLNANSGTVSPATIELTDGQPFGNLPTPTRNGFTFAGWYKVPGHEESRITNNTIYKYATHGDMIHARWTKKTITLTFVGFDGKTVIGTVNVSADGGSLVDIDASKYKLPVDDGKFFAGYYTRINGEGDRIYSGVPSKDLSGGDDLLPVILTQASFTQNTTLYAFQTHVKHVTHWDYSYKMNDSEGERWVNIGQGDNDSRIKYGKLTFMDNGGNVLKWIYFQADGVTNKSGMGDELSTHTTSVGQFHLQLADATHAETANGELVQGDDETADDGKAGYWNVYFTDEQLSRFTRYNFQPIAERQNVEQEESAVNWLRTTDPAAHDTWFTYTAAEEANNAPLNWTVKLTNLKVYPDYIIAKPLFTSDQNLGEWMEISQLAKLDGVTCKKVSETGTGDGSVAVYAGSYPVWKTGSTGGYGYAVGMVGFEVDGQKVYLNTTNPGHFSTDFNSANTTVDGDQGTSEWNGAAFPGITYTINAPSIPVIRFLPGSAQGAKLDGATPEIVWGTEGSTISGDEFTKYKATRPGYAFVGWSETDGATTPTYTDSYTFNGAKTLYPVWKDATAPVITPAKMVTCEETVEVTITDNEGLTDLTVTVNGESQTFTGDGKFTLPVPTEEYKDYVIVATDKDGNSSTVTVRIYKEHGWHQHDAADPTKTEDGSFIDYTHCDQCNEYKDNNDQEITEEWVEKNIIPASSVLVKTEDGGIETTRDWDDDVNGAIAKVKINADPSESWSYLKMTGDAEVTNSIIDTPALPATLDLNGNSLLVDGVDGIISGNEDVTILLKDDGVTEYTNLSKVTGTPTLYVRDYFAGYATRAGKWQALCLPFAYGSTIALDYTFGTPASVEITETEAKLTINKETETLDAFKFYFVKSSTGKLSLNITGVDLLPYKAPENYVETVSDDYNFRGSLKNDDNKPTTAKQYWVLTNGGEFCWAKVGSHQRPYHWVVNPAISATSVQFFTIIEDGELTGIDSTEEAELNINAPIYTIDGLLLPMGSTLVPGKIYIQNGKKFQVTY